jgi:two-component system, OmpR family, response regulator
LTSSEEPYRLDAAGTELADSGVFSGRQKPVPKIMIIDDDPSFGEFARKVAQGCGYEVSLAFDATCFPAEYAHRRPDLIMLDLQMPSIDGVELLRILAALGCTVPILVMSGFDVKVVDTARRIGAARGLHMLGVLTKPIRAADLRVILVDFKREFDSRAG